MQNWSYNSWKSKTIKQLPLFEDENHLTQVCSSLQSYPGLVTNEEITSLKSLLSQAQSGNVFLIQAGDCAESFDKFSTENINKTFKELLKMAIILSLAGDKNVIRVGRFAGQYAKPRSGDVETKNGVDLPVYRGDIFNSIKFEASARRTNPERMLTAYFHSCSILNYLRSHTNAKYTDLKKILSEILHFIETDAEHERYKDLVNKTQKGLQVIQSSSDGSKGISMPSKPLDFYTSHEALHLHYEQSLLRISKTGSLYCSSAHLLWIGDRTRFLDSAHVEFLSGISNPIGIKVGPECNADELLSIIDKLNPKNESGKIVLITRMGTSLINEALPKIIQQVRVAGCNVLWSSDPMHGNTVKNPQGIKTRHFDDILAETTAFFEICKEQQVCAGGIHLEMTGTDVTECIGGKKEVDLSYKYESLCDPRLNADQAIELAFKMCHLFKL